MAKSACFAARDIAADLHLDHLTEAHDQFETSLLALREGSGMLRLLPETKPSLLMAQRRVMDAWPEMDRPIKAIIRDRSVSTDMILELQPISLAVKAVAEDAAQRTAMAYSDDTSGASFTQNMTVDIAARQRTLMQTMVNDIAKGLALVKTEWMALKPAFEAAANGDIPDAERLIVMDHATEKMLEVMDGVVSLYSEI